MNTKSQLDQDIKTAMLAGDKSKVTVLRGLKSAILYVEVAEGSRDEGLAEAKVRAVLAKEAKKRQDSIDMYTQAGATDRASTELAEKAIIETYLPKQLSDVELAAIVDSVIADGVNNLGQAIGAVKAQTAGQADGGRIAAMVKAKLS